MKAIVVRELGEPEVLKLEDIPTPEPELDQIRVRLHAIGINPIDTYLRSGAQGYNPALPYTPGFDGAGIIDAIGDHVTHVSVGDRVYLTGAITGTYAEFALCSPDQVKPLPANVSFAQGAGVYIPYYTSYRALFQRANVTPGETVMIHGASGAVGIAAMQWASQFGLTLIATASTEQGRQLAMDQGADLVVDHSDPGHYSQIMEFTKDRGVDVILEMMANINLGHDLKILATAGRVVTIGSRGDIEITPRDIMNCDGAILGMALKNFTGNVREQAVAAINAGLIKQTLAPVIRDELSLSHAADAHKRVLAPGAYGKIILIP